MLRNAFFLLFAMHLCTTGVAGADERVPTSPIPDPLRFEDGRKVDAPALWAGKRRAEILELFREHVYGRDPIGRPAGLTFTALAPPNPAFEGRAMRQVIRATYSAPGGPGEFQLTTFHPTAAPPRGCLLLIVNRSRAIIDEAENHPLPFWPVPDIIARGYATAAIHISDFAPDNPATSLQNGVFRLYPDPEGKRPADAWAAIAAWAWGASRAVDYLVTDPRLGGAPIGVIGHSRGGKTALWCGAQDERVALTISNESGRTGAAVGRLSRGETVARINGNFPHWFNANYKRYDTQPDALPVDQHQLVALLAPRLAYIASAAEDAHADPFAEFQAGHLASPVYRLLGLPGLEPAVFPAVGGACQEGRIGYHLRPGGHDLLVTDWMRFLDFADRHWPARRAAP